MSNARRYRRTQTRGGVLFILPGIPDDASIDFKNGLAVRNQATRDGRCPACGAVSEAGYVDAVGLPHFVMEHEDDCPVLATVEAHGG